MSRENAGVIFDNMKSRRVSRSFTGEPVDDALLWQIVQAGRWAASGGNLRPHRFLITRNPVKIDRVRAFSPGMLVTPPAIIAILIDQLQLNEEWLSIYPSAIPHVDVGTAAQNMLNMSHALGLGSCPVTSFSRSGVGGVLELPEHLTVELMIMIGHPKPVERAVNPNAPKGVTARDLTSWEVFGNRDPN